MENKWIDDQYFRILFAVMIVGLVIIAIIPRKVMLIGSANDSSGLFNMDGNGVDNSSDDSVYTDDALEEIYEVE